MNPFDWPTTRRAASCGRDRDHARNDGWHSVVDAGLIGVPLLSPWFMGGRHPLGELVIVLLAVTVALAWLGRRALDPRGATWTRSPARMDPAGGGLAGDRADRSLATVGVGPAFAPHPAVAPALAR